MRAPLSWLKDFTPLPVDPRDEAAVARLGEELDALGLVVASVERVGSGFDGVVLARVLTIEGIEGADRVRRVLVDAGGREPTEIVCGARNFAVGDVVPLATVGAELPNGMVISRRTMRGVTSDGMLCSARELELADDAEGLLILASPGSVDAPLPDGAEPGRPLAEHLGIEPDVVFDLEVEPNRPDALSMVGIARDLAAKYGLPFVIPEPALAESEPAASTVASAVTEAIDRCPRLVARVITGVVPVASPRHVANRLELAGMRPINSVVDASNYVMLELGQPTHPYDLDRLPGAGIAVRLASPGEELETLDGSHHTLGVDRSGSPVDELVITDAEDGVVGLAGVMGGASSEITGATTRVLLEVADFDARAIGTAAQRHGMRTEASTRFWRGIDPAGLERAAARVCELVAVAQTAAGLAAPEIPVGPLTSGPGRPPRAAIALRPSRLNALLGTELAAARMTELLTPLGFAVAAEGDNLSVTPPTFRPDVTREVDLIEEVARHHGYAEIARRERRSPKVGHLTEIQRARRELRRALQGLGASEAWTSSLVDPELIALLGAPEPGLRVLNPVVSGEDALRTHLLAGLLAALARNEARRYPFIRLFETGKVFNLAGELPDEHEHLALVLAREGDDARAAVGAWRALLEAMKVDATAVREVPLVEAASTSFVAGLHPSRSAVLVAPGERPIGALGEVDPQTAVRFGVGERPIGVLVVDLESFFALPKTDLRARSVSRYPSADIDLAFVLEEEYAAAALERVLAEAAGERLESIALLDVYRGPGLPPATRSLAFRLRFSALDHTLTDEEIGELRGRCIDAAAGRLSATLRA